MVSNQQGRLAKNLDSTIVSNVGDAGAVVRITTRKQDADIPDWTEAVVFDQKAYI